MNLENVNKNSVFYFLNIFQLTILKYYLNVLDSKENTKEQIKKSLTSFNYFCFWLSILPFLWFICKLPSSTNRATLNSNLPGLNNVSNEIFWETLLNSFDYNEKLFHSVKELEVNSNSFLLNHDQVNQSIQTLIRFSSSSVKEQFKEFKPRELDGELNGFTQFDLDEIPIKLESNLSKSKTAEVLSKSNQDLISVNLFEKNEPEKNSKALILDIKKPASKEHNVKIAVSKDKTKLKLLKKSFNFANPTWGAQLRSPNSTGMSAKSIHNWAAFSKASETLARYYRNLFFETTGLTPLKNDKSNLVVKETSSIRPRFMTGFIYPDMNSNQIWRLKLSKFFKPEDAALTIAYYPKSIYFSSFPFFENATNSQISLPIYEIGQLDGENGREFFLTHDLSNFDLTVKNRFSTQFSIFEQAILNNTETIKPLYFFANSDKSGLVNLVNTGNTVERDEKVLNNLNHNIFKTSLAFSLVDPTVKVDEAETLYHQLPVNNIFKEGTFAISIADLRDGKVEILPSTVTNHNIKVFFLKTQVPSNFFQGSFLNSPKSTETNQKKVIIANNLINVQNNELEYSPNLYKREIGSYWKTKIHQTEEFLTVDEVLSSKSILSLSLFGFLISSFLILKTAYADYAKEFSSYLLDLISSGKGLVLDPSTIEWLNQELGLEEKKGGIRVFPKNFSKKRFTDIAGIKELLPELSELVWFLRNKGRKFAITPLTSKSILLVGPPGTGKTLLVQALAGEAEVPVVAQSTSVLASMNQDLTPGDAIRLSFQKARSLAPCILFLDELDSLGLKRDSLLTNNSQQVIGLANEEIQHIPFFAKTNSHEVEMSDNNDSDYLTNQLRISITNEFNSKKQQEREQVAALTQLLIEIDGLQTNAGILVIGATNRSSILDPALTRPGRFSKTISLPLPDKAKRIEIFKLRSTQLGWETNVNWDYLAQRTKGFSAGDLATIVNQSSIQAILANSRHTLESFETAITVLTTYPIEKSKTNGNTQDPYHLKREVYYKVAQSLYNYFADVEGRAAFVELSPRQPNPRHYQILANVNNDKNAIRSRFELEKLLTSLVAGKAGEVLMLLTSTNESTFYWESDLAKNDLYESTKLVFIMFQDWYLYSSFLQQQKFLLIPNNQNQFEYKKNEELFSLFEETVRYLEQQISNQYTITESIGQRAQWKTNIIHEMSNVDSLFAEWSRFHLPDPQETERNPEWIPPEEYYHENENKRYIPSTEPATADSDLVNTGLLSFSELLLIERDRYIQTILLASFNKALVVLETNRELLDILACFLFKHKILRSFELSDLIKKHSKEK